MSETIDGTDAERPTSEDTPTALGRHAPPSLTRPRIAAYMRISGAILAEAGIFGAVALLTLAPSLDRPFTLEAAFACTGIGLALALGGTLLTREAGGERRARQSVAFRLVKPGAPTMLGEVPRNLH